MRKLKILSVKPAGSQQTYNLRIAQEPHNFILSNGIISGNSHSFSYSLVTYWTSFLKAHFPVHFYASLLSHENDEDRIIQYTCSAREMGITILPPDINKSDLYHRPEGNCIRFGLGLIKGMPIGAAKEIIAVRDAKV